MILPNGPLIFPNPFLFAQTMICRWKGVEYLRIRKRLGVQNLLVNDVKRGDVESN